MSWSEKIIDRILGVVLFLAFMGLLILGSIQLSSVAPSKSSKNNQKPVQENVKIKCVHCGKTNNAILFKSVSIPDSITIDCIYCDWQNTRSLIQLRDTVNHQPIIN